VDDRLWIGDRRMSTEPDCRNASNRSLKPTQAAVQIAATAPQPA